MLRSYLITAFRNLRRQRWYAVRQTVKALEGLDDRVLADIGVYRDEVETVARLVAENPGTDHREFSRR